MNPIGKAYARKVIGKEFVMTRKSDMKNAVGGGGSAPLLLRIERWGDKAARQLGSEAAKCNILLSPLEGEKKFLGELCELKNFREGYKKYKNSDRATECAIVCVGAKKGKIKMNENNLQQKQPNNPVAFLENKHSLLPDTVFSRFNKCRKTVTGWRKRYY